MDHMARKHRSASQVAIHPWCSATLDGREKAFFQVGVTLLESPAFQRLTAAQKILYFCMIQEAGRSREFQFPERVFEKYGLSHSAARKGIKELISRGFIERASQGGVTWGETLYRFSFAWKKT